MNKFGQEYQAGLKKVESAQLSAIEILALRSFLLWAAEPNDAGRYVLRRLSENPQCTLEETLRSIRKDWLTLANKMCRDDQVPPQIEAGLRERDGHRCCITGSTVDVKPIYILAPSLVNDSDLCPGGYLRPMLEALLTRERVEEIFSLLETRNQKNELKNLWLMSRPVRASFRYGQFRIKKSIYLEMPDHTFRDERHGGWWVEAVSPRNILPESLDGHESFYKIPSTPNPDTHPLPVNVLLNAHIIITRALHFHVIEEHMRLGWPEWTEPRTLGQTGRFLLRGFLRVLPNFARIPLYKLIVRLVEYFDPIQRRCSIKCLPLGLCLKVSRQYTENEANALLLVEKYTTINAPKLIDSVVIDDKSGFILMTRIFGHPLNGVHYRTTFEEREQIGKDLAGWIEQLRRIPNNTNHLIANTLGGPICDHRHGQDDNSWGPYNSVADFTDRLVRDVVDIDKRKHERPISLLYEKKHEVVFTHSDLHMSNIIIRSGRLHGLIDFENAGFKPEYWEFTRALWPYGSQNEKEYIYHSTFGDKYEEELEAEVFILLNAPFVL
ncbi:uncharacterized protein CIMG_05834 [Coccidioides immitis RS]|uniref:Aminoglycoside phosphotransferase domain-containing protein n=4 Tax=Coccidioides immitis TaxID=5501 RepID=J3K6V9_COCIM|nr:uncharacterized protein CIMG_05834 [Coccidioides immitis RS]KMP02904.1 hypothetical protein CIRG_02596 [Coccidioides immitis RMSCC 2394]KMU82083.1 hypothetical protein CISG_09613 [Coccidioides immitis RMSCC 3703]KMU91794.1 hypothetical protein CIHG_09667 [Coccidioides immitis H538.4]TPX23344.1 hypothetical protein DIZ76_012673 [Coccidioides immitis]EAS30355.3 hypothetical protein CIMG_05834 [Coccidioides immitis RS]